MRRLQQPFFTRLRFATAMVSTTLLNLQVFGYSLRSVCSPGFNCHGCPWATAACPIGVMAYGSALQTIPVLAIASVLAVGVVLGRLVCSFACPFGLFQELLYRIPTPKIRLPRFARYGKYAALVLLVFIFPWMLGFDPGGYLAVGKPELNKGMAGDIDVSVVVENPGTEPVVSPKVLILYLSTDSKEEVYREVREFPDITVPPGQAITLPVFEVPNHLANASLVVDSPQSSITPRSPYSLYYCRLCPKGTLTSAIPAFASGKTGLALGDWARQRWLPLSILGFFLLMMVISARPFCRLFCPLGAMYALTARAAITRIAINPATCISCGACDRACTLGLDVRREIGGAECIACGECKRVCPTSGIHRRFGL
jgi:ferredoxin